MKTIIITGGCGFIGGHFIRLINRLTDWRVVNVDKLTYAGSVNGIGNLQEGQRYRFVKADIVDRDRMSSLFAEEKPWAVVNFAAESHVDRSILDPGPFLQTNLIGVQILLDMARQYEVERFLQISTDEVYGDAEGKESFQDTDIDIFLSYGHIFEPLDVVYNVAGGEYAPETEAGIIWNDPGIGIDWPDNSPILSEKDAILPVLKDADNDFVYE